MIFAEDGDMMLAFFKNMDKIFPTMGFVCLPLIRFKNPPLSGFFVPVNLVQYSKHAGGREYLTFYLAGF
ncbi:hypothetical protein AXK30_06770 [Escherichia coli]|nr:hypothetical protein AXK30_06770 [Escherichia coli]